MTACSTCALARDFEIAVVDGERGLGNGYLLPAGPLREPAERLAQVDAVVHQRRGRLAWRGADRRVAPRGASSCGCRASGCGRSAGSGAAVALSQLSPASGCMPWPASAIRERFFAQLARRRARGDASIRFPDHHRYRVPRAGVRRRRCRC